MSNAASVSSDDPRHARLRQMIAEFSILEGDYKLASGGSSSVFFDMKRTLLQPQGLALAGSLMLDHVAGTEATAVGGLVLGACPIVGAIAMASAGTAHEVAAFYVRKEAKNTGTQTLIEGYDISRHKAVYMVEDVTTSGGSVIKAIDIVRRETNCDVLGVLTVVDRQQGAAEALEARGLPLISLYRMDEFTP